jgi:hypothetical protein
LNIKNQKDFVFGLISMGIGAAFVWGATTYKVGDASRMGPGYFPLMLGILMTILGVVITFKALVFKTKGDDKIGEWGWKPLILIILANFAFGLLLVGLPSIKLPAMGMIVAIYALIFIASMAKDGWTVKSTFILATVLAVGCYIVFILLLKITIPVWPAFITG